MKQWPKELKTVAFEDVMKPIREALDFMYTLVRKNEGKDVPYDGYNHKHLASLPPADEMLTEDMFQYHKERGREPIDSVLQLAFLVGMEQGRREVLEKIDRLPRNLDRYVEMLREGTDPKSVAVMLELEGELLNVVREE